MKNKLATLDALEHGNGIDVQKILTNSARSQFVKCRQKFLFEYIYLLKSKKLVVPFFTGGVYHAEMDSFYTDKNWTLEKSINTINEKIAAAIENAFDNKEAEKILLQRAILIGMVTGYTKFFKRDLRHWTNIKTEFNICVPIPGSDWQYSGKLDMAFTKDGKVHLAEHKTSAVIDSSYVNRLPLDPQIKSYFWLWLQKYDEFFKSVYYTAAKKTQLRQRKGDTFKDYIERVQADYSQFQEKYFYREVLRVSKKDVKTFGINIRKMCQEIEHCIKMEFFYQNADECTKRGTCIFMPLCLGGVNNRTLSNYFIKGKLHEELEIKEQK